MQCDQIRFDALLDSDHDTDAHDPDLVRHLESCSRCRDQLAALAADADQWNAIERWLSTDVDDGCFADSLDAESLKHRVRWQRPAAWNDTLARSLLSEPAHPEMLGRIGRYDVERLIGSGGMGVVFKAFDTELNRPVAIKLLAPHLSHHSSARNRFAREARAAAAVVDDHVVPIHNVETDAEHPFLVMKYIGGGSLQQRLDRTGPLDVCEVLRIGMHTAKGLAAAHAQGLIHRDVKPSNILLDEGVDRALLTDFGLARANDDASLTHSGFHPGTPHYMSPEQVRGETLDARSDLFGLGCVLYALCTGHPPFQSETSYAVLRRITDDQPHSIRKTNPSIPEWLEHIVVTLLAKDPAERFESAEHVAELLERCLAHVQQSRPLPLPRPAPLPRRVAALMPRRRSRPPVRGLAIALAFLLPVLFAGAMIVERSMDDVSTLPLTEQRPLVQAIREFNNLHPADAQGNVQPPLTQSEVIAALLWLTGNDQLSDEVVLAVQPVIHTRDRMLPPGWRFTGGLAYERTPHGVVQTWRIQLETDGLAEPILIRENAIHPPRSLRESSEDPAGDLASLVPISELVASFNEAQASAPPGYSVPHQPSQISVDEVLAAIALSHAASESATAPDPTAADPVETAIATHHLPVGSRLELVSSAENAIGQFFRTETIQMVLSTSDQAQPWKPIPIRHRFIERDLQNPAATRWSRPASNGLQAGFRVSPAQQTYERGQVIELDFFYRSVISESVPATLPAAFQFDEVSGIRLERIHFVRPTWSDGSTHTQIGREPKIVRGHRLQICFDSDETLQPGVNLRAMTRPEASHYVRFTVPNPGDDAAEDSLEIRERLHFRIALLTPPEVLPLYASHYYEHWGTSVPGHRLPERSNPDPAFIDPFQIGVSLGPAEKSRIPVYYASGLQVTKVAPHSPAAHVGIEEGDILLSWEGHQIVGDDPQKPFQDYSRPNEQLRKLLETYAAHRGWASFNMNFDLLDHRTGQVLRISPWFGQAAGGGPTKKQLLQRMEERRLLRQEP